MVISNYIPLWNEAHRRLHHSDERINENYNNHFRNLVLTGVSIALLSGAAYFGLVYYVRGPEFLGIQKNNKANVEQKLDHSDSLETKTIKK